VKISDAEFSAHGDAVVARLTGEIDLSNAEALGDAIALEMPNKSSSLILDLTEVDYIDSAGIRLIFQLRAKLRARSQTLVVVITPTSPANDALRLAGVAASIETVESLSEALSQLSS
jgi:stage II sporulation protein AA (anti-sigma F factor antagonist)